MKVAGYNEEIISGNKRQILLMIRSLIFSEVEVRRDNLFGEESPEFFTFGAAALFAVRPVMIPAPPPRRSAASPWQT
jgi:hypothetical protein